MCSLLLWVTSCGSQEHVSIVILVSSLFCSRGNSITLVFLSSESVVLNGNISDEHTFWAARCNLFEHVKLTFVSICSLSTTESNAIALVFSSSISATFNGKVSNKRTLSVTKERVESFSREVSVFVKTSDESILIVAVRNLINYFLYKNLIIQFYLSSYIFVNYTYMYVHHLRDQNIVSSSVSSYTDLFFPAL